MHAARANQGAGRSSENQGLPLSGTTGVNAIDRDAVVDRKGLCVFSMEQVVALR